MFQWVMMGIELSTPLCLVASPYLNMENWFKVYTGHKLQDSTDLSLTWPWTFSQTSSLHLGQFLAIS